MVLDMGTTKKGTLRIICFFRMRITFGVFGEIRHSDLVRMLTSRILRGRYFYIALRIFPRKPSRFGFPIRGGFCFPPEFGPKSGGATREEGSDERKMCQGDSPHSRPGGLCLYRLSHRKYCPRATSDHVSRKKDAS